VILKDYVDRRFKNELIGMDPLQREYLWERAWELDRIERFAPNMAHVVDCCALGYWREGSEVAGVQINWWIS